MLKTALEYRRLKYTRDNLRELPDLPETAVPRFQKGVLLSHRRGQRRMATWTKFAQIPYRGNK